VSRSASTATAISAFVLIVALFRLLFGPTGYFSAVNGKDPDGDGPLGPLFGGADLSFLAIGDPTGLIVAIGLGLVVGFLAYTWARQGEHARLFPVWIGGATTGLVAAMISAPIAAGVFGGVTGGGTDLLVALFRTLGLGVLQSALAQGLTSDPLDKTISYTVVFLILGALPVTVRTMYSRGEATVVE
jgi:energy-coupling factor transport system substrate-specific component